MAKFKKLIIKQCGVIAGITVLGLVVAATIGIPILSFVFGVELHQYKTELCVVMIGGGMLAYSTFFSTVITIIRLQNTLLLSYGITALAAMKLSGVLVTTYGIMGAAVMYAVLMTILTIILFVIMVCRIHKEELTLIRG